LRHKHVDQVISQNNITWVFKKKPEVVMVVDETSSDRPEECERKNIYDFPIDQ
jgi:hypothetical protein